MISREFLMRDFEAGDASAVNAVALDAFEQFGPHYTDWPLFRSKVGETAALAEAGELIVAMMGPRLIGAVAYVGPGRTKPSYFQPGWPVVRSLVVSPSARGRGVGRALTEECVSRARRDKAPLLALHTSPIMSIALSMYLRMGFAFHSTVPRIHGVEYNIYVKDLS